MRAARPPPGRRQDGPGAEGCRRGSGWMNNPAPAARGRTWSRSVAGSRHTRAMIWKRCATLPCRHHRPDRGGFGAEAGAGGRIDADTVEVRTALAVTSADATSPNHRSPPDGIDAGSRPPVSVPAHDLDASSRAAPREQARRHRQTARHGGIHTDSRPRRRVARAGPPAPGAARSNWSRASSKTPATGRAVSPAGSSASGEGHPRRRGWFGRERLDISGGRCAHCGHLEFFAN